MSNNQTLGYDGIKKMLNTLRNLNESVSSNKRSLNEDIEQNQLPAEDGNEQKPTDFSVVNDVQINFIAQIKQTKHLQTKKKPD